MKSKIKKNNFFGVMYLFFHVFGIICFMIFLSLGTYLSSDYLDILNKSKDFDVYYGFPVRSIVSIFLLLSMLSLFTRLFFYKRTPKAFIDNIKNKEKQFLCFLEKNKIIKILVIIICSLILCILLLSPRVFIKFII